MAPHQVCSVLEGRSPPPAPSPPPYRAASSAAPAALPRPAETFGRGAGDAPRRGKPAAARGEGGRQPAATPGCPRPVPAGQGRAGSCCGSSVAGGTQPRGRGMRVCPGARPCAPETRRELLRSIFSQPESSFCSPNSPGEMWNCGQGSGLAVRSELCFQRGFHEISSCLTGIHLCFPFS